MVVTVASGRKFSSLFTHRLFHQLPISLSGLTLWMKTALGAVGGGGVFLFGSGLERLPFRERKSEWLIEFLVYRKAFKK